MHDGSSCVKFSSMRCKSENLRRKWPNIVSAKADTHELARMAVVSQAANRCLDGLPSVSQDEVLQVADGDPHDVGGVRIRGNPAVVLPAGLAVRELENDYGGDGVDGQIVLHGGESEEAMIDALPDVRQLVVVANCEHHDATGNEGAGARD